MRKLFLAASLLVAAPAFAGNKVLTLVAPTSIADAGFKWAMQRRPQGAEVGPVVEVCYACARDAAAGVEADCAEARVEAQAASSTATALANACLTAWKTAQGY